MKLREALNQHRNCTKVRTIEKGFVEETHSVRYFVIVHCLTCGLWLRLDEVNIEDKPIA